MRNLCIIVPWKALEVDIMQKGPELCQVQFFLAVLEITMTWTGDAPVPATSPSGFLEQFTGPGSIGQISGRILQYGEAD